MSPLLHHTPTHARDAVFSVTRWLNCLFNIWPFRTMKICPIIKIIAKVDSLFGQILNIFPRNGQILFKILFKWPKIAKIWSHWWWWFSLSSRSRIRTFGRLANSMQEQIVQVEDEQIAHQTYWSKA